MESSEGCHDIVVLYDTTDGLGVQCTKCERVLCLVYRSKDTASQRDARSRAIHGRSMGWCSGRPPAESAGAA